MFLAASSAHRGAAVRPNHRSESTTRNKRLSIVAMAIVAMFASLAMPGQADAVVLRTIDDFTEEAAVSPWPVFYASFDLPPGVPNTDTFVETGLTDSKVIGTVRDSDTTLEAVPVGFWTFSATVNPPIPEFNYAASNGIDGKFNLRYDGNSAGTAGMLDFDVATDFPSVTGIQIDIDPDIVPAISVLVTIESDVGGADNSATLSMDTVGSGFQTVFFPFVDFVGALDLSDIDAVNIFVDAPVDADFGINLIGFGRPGGSIPEPATWILSIIALTTLNATSRRRRLRK